MRPLMDNDILRWLPCRDGKLFRLLRPWPYDEWSARFQRLLTVGTIGYHNQTVIRLTRDGEPKR